MEYYYAWTMSTELTVALYLDGPIFSKDTMQLIGAAKLHQSHPQTIP